MLLPMLASAAVLAKAPAPPALSVKEATFLLSTPTNASTAELALTLALPKLSLPAKTRP